MACPPDGTSSTSANPSNPARKCNNCKKSEGPLMRCAKCQTASYCGRECQAADWKVHKRHCALLAASRTSGTSNSSSASIKANKLPKRSNSKPFTAIFHNNFLHDRPEQETFEILIDVLRMKQEDTHNIEGDTMTGTIYNGEVNSIPAFRVMLGKASQVQGLLPPWWNDDKAAKCILYGQRSGHGFSLAAAQEKSDVQDHWKDPQMPMKLRMLGEKIYGVGPGGQPAASMLSMMMSMEGGNGPKIPTHLDLGGWR